MSIATPTSIDVDGYDLKVIHELYLLMMDDLHQYCVDNGIHYSFFGRHSSGSGQIQRVHSMG